MRSVAAVIALVACVQAGLWALAQDHVTAPNFDGQLASVSYAPFGGTAHPDSGTQAQAEQIRSDLQLLAPLTRAIRTYSSTGGVELVPGIAQEFGLRVTVGAYLSGLRLGAGIGVGRAAKRRIGDAGELAVEIGSARLVRRKSPQSGLHARHEGDHGSDGAH